MEVHQGMYLKVEFNSFSSKNSVHADILQSWQAHACSLDLWPEWRLPPSMTSPFHIQHHTVGGKCPLDPPWILSAKFSTLQRGQVSCFALFLPGKTLDGGDVVLTTKPAVNKSSLEYPFILCFGYQGVDCLSRLQQLDKLTQRNVRYN